MALAVSGAGVLTISVVDNNDKVSNVSFNVGSDTDTVAEVITRANAIRDAMAAAIDARITGARFSFLLDETAPLATVPASSEVERKLIVPLRGATRAAKVQYEVPSPIFTVEQLGTDTVVYPGVVQALIDALLANTTTNRGEPLTQLGGVVYVDHRNRKRVR